MPKLFADIINGSSSNNPFDDIVNGPSFGNVKGGSSSSPSFAGVQGGSSFAPQAAPSDAPIGDMPPDFGSSPQAEASALQQSGAMDRAANAISETPSALYHGLAAGGNEFNKWLGLAASAPIGLFDDIVGTHAQDDWFKNVVQPQDEAAQYHQGKLGEMALPGQIVGGVGQAVPDLMLGVLSGGESAVPRAVPLVESAGSTLYRTLANTVEQTTTQIAPLAEKASANAYGQAIADGKTPWDATADALKAIGSTMAMGAAAGQVEGNLLSRVVQGAAANAAVGESVRELEGREFDPAELGVNLALGGGFAAAHGRAHEEAPPVRDESQASRRVEESPLPDKVNENAPESVVQPRAEDASVAQPEKPRARYNNDTGQWEGFFDDIVKPDEPAANSESPVVPDNAPQEAQTGRGEATPKDDSILDFEDLVPEEVGVAAQTAWHGTPHRGIENEGFKLNKIGTGEGAQAYGHGIYFAGNRDVSESYRKGLSIENKGYPVVEIDGIPLHTSDPNSSLSSPFDSSDVTRPITGEEAKQMLLEAASRENWDKSKQAADDAVRERIQNTPADRVTIRPAKEHEGQLYSADIPENHELLDWDKPLSEQPEKVKDALWRAGVYFNWREAEAMKPELDAAYDAATDEKGIAAWRALIDRRNALFGSDGLGPTAKGRDVISTLNLRLGSERAASEALLAAGIPGLRYLDGGSRSKGEGSHNYVIWDESRLNKDIKTHYAQAEAKGKSLPLNEDPNVTRDDLGFYYRGGKLVGRPKETTRPLTKEELAPNLSSPEERAKTQPLHDRINSELNNGEKAWKYLAKGDDHIASLAKKILALGDDHSHTSVKAVSPEDLLTSRDSTEHLLGRRLADGFDAPLGLYEGRNDRVLLRGAGFDKVGVRRDVMAHELLHAKLIGKINELRKLHESIGENGDTSHLHPKTKEALEAYRELERVREALANHPKLKDGHLMPEFYRHAVSDVNELTSIAMTDRGVRALLKDVKVGTVSAWSKITDAWRKILGLGRLDKNIIEHISDQVDSLVRYNPEAIAAESRNNLGWEMAEPRFAAQESAPRPTKDQIQARAQEAIRRGADPEKVRQRIQELYNKHGHEPDVTGIKNEAVASDREVRGLDAIKNDLGRGREAMYKEAERRIAENPTYGEEVATSVIKSPRPLTGEEVMAINIAHAKTHFEYRAARARVADAVAKGNKDAELLASMDMQTIAGKLETLETAANLAGTENSYGLSARQSMLKDDFTLAEMQKSALAAKGKKLTPEDTKVIEGLQKQIQDLQDKLAQKEKTRVESKRKRVPLGDKIAADKEFSDLVSQLKKLNGDNMRGHCLL